MKSKVGQTPQQLRRIEFKKKLVALNREAWKRDKSSCIICGSGKIAGEPFISGAHHILTRNTHKDVALDIRNLLILCTSHHDSNADTIPFRKMLMKKMTELYGYSYENAPYCEVLNA